MSRVRKFVKNFVGLGSAGLIAFSMAGCTGPEDQYIPELTSQACKARLAKLQRDDAQRATAQASLDKENKGAYRSIHSLLPSLNPRKPEVYTPTVTPRGPSQKSGREH